MGDRLLSISRRRLRVGKKLPPLPAPTVAAQTASAPDLYSLSWCVIRLEVSRVEEPDALIQETLFIDYTLTPTFALTQWKPPAFLIYRQHRYLLQNLNKLPPDRRDGTEKYRVIYVLWDMVDSGTES